jgi:hypothetical protein
MRRFTRVLQGLLQKHLTQKRVIALIALGVLIVLREKFEALLTDLLVTPVLSWCKSDLPTDFVLAAIGFSITGMYLLRAKRGYVTSLDSVLLALIVSAIYLFYRVQSDPWEFLAFYLIPSLKYADILILWSAGTVLVWAKAFFTRSQGNSPRPLRFSLDEPIHIDKEDELERFPLAELLAERIRQTQGKYSFAVGITGPWGSGKTSFMNLIKQKLDSDDVITVDFNPWLGTESHLIVKDFFQTLRFHLKPYSSQIDAQLEEYSRKFVHIEGGSAAKILRVAIGLFSASNVKEGFDQVNRTLKKLNKQVVVFIDDFDRLEDDEIISVLRLIRNTANFSNLKFVVAFDKAYVENAIKKINHTNHTNYLDKIFLHYTQLSKIDSYYLKKELEADLCLRFPEQSKDIKNTLFNSYAVGQEVHVKKFIRSIRDLKRFINQFTVDFDHLKDDVHFSDYLKIQLIKYRHPSVYSAFYEQYNKFIEPSATVSAVGDRKAYRLIQVNGASSRVYALKEFMDNRAEPLSISNDDIMIVMEVMESLFDGRKLIYGVSDRHLSIMHPQNFDRYFQNRLTAHDLSEREFKQALVQPLEQLNRRISEWVQDGKKMSVIRRYLDIEIRTLESREDFEKIIQSIVFLGKCKNLNSTGYEIGYYHKDFIDKLSNHEKSISKKFYGGNDEEYRSFIRSLFYRAESPYTFESDLLQSVLNDFYYDNFIIPLEEINDQLVKYLTDYLRSARELDRHCWDLYSKCSIPRREYTSASTYRTEWSKNPMANEVFIDFVENRALHDFLLAIIEGEIREQKTFRVVDVVVRLFGSYEAFQEFLDRQDEEDHEYLSEFKEFLEVFTANEPKVYVPFEFEKIPIHEKIQQR